MKNLKRSILFKNVQETEIENMIKEISYEIVNYEKDDIIAMEGDECTSLGIVLQGNIEIQKLSPTGKGLTINYFQAGNIFGEALVFSGDHHNYPATITSATDTKIMFICKEELVKVFLTNKYILTNFLEVLSNRILMLNTRITALSQDSVRKKIANFLLDEYKSQRTYFLNIPLTRRKLSELLNIPRPSLSRELVKMKEDNIIDFHRNTIKILNIESLKNSLLK